MPQSVISNPCRLFCFPFYFKEYLNPQVRLNKMVNEHSVNFHPSLWSSIYWKMHLRAKKLNLDIFDHPHATFFQKSIPQLKEGEETIKSIHYFYLFYFLFLSFIIFTSNEFPHMSYYHRFTKVVASLYEFKLSGYTLHSCKEL